MREWIMLDQGAGDLGPAAVPRPVQRILRNRGYKTDEQIERFLNPRLEHLHSPFLFPDMEKAVHRIIDAQKRGDKILIHGDYDADGVTATAMLVLALKTLGIGAAYYIPHRMKEGYGFSMTGVEYARAHVFSVLITVDCGTTALAEIEAAQASGIDVIVCDHHEPGERLPSAFALFNPEFDNSSYPFKGLSGAGITFKLIQAIFSIMGAPARAFEYLDLCALGTVADVAPLVDENRVLTRFGLEELARTRNLGLESLMDVAGIAGRTPVPYHLSFVLGPRVNAGGRMSEASAALKLFLTRDRTEARELAQKLDGENRARQRVENVILSECSAMVAEQGLEKKRVIVLAGEGWHEGVIGVVAARIAEKFYRPTLLVALKDQRGKGSGRSIPGFHLAEALRACHSHLDAFGGHKQAVGFTIRPDRIADFDRAINDHAALFSPSTLAPRTYIDTGLALGEIDGPLVELLGCFEPTGIENPAPTFLAQNLEVVGYPRVVGRNHLKFALREKSTVFPAIGFGLADRIVDLKVGQSRIDVVFSINEDAFGGKKKTLLKIKDLRASQSNVA